MPETDQGYITVQMLGVAWAAVWMKRETLKITDETYWDVFKTGIGRYPGSSGYRRALQEARSWAEAEEIPFKDVISMTVDLQIPERPDFSTVELEDKQLRGMKYCSLKLDGRWTGIVPDGLGGFKVYSQLGTDITEKVCVYWWYHHLLTYWKTPRKIMGELWQRGVPCSDISTHLAEGKPLSFYAFWVEGIPNLDDASEYCKDRNINFIPYQEVVKHGFLGVQCGAWYQLVKRNMSPADGLVFTDGEGIYRKWKPVRTIDLILVGFEFGNGRLTGKIAKLKCRTAEGQIVALAAGLSDAERDYIYKNFRTLEGKVVEIKYNSVETRGRLRHPRFVRFRDDKLPEDCTLYQDEHLAKAWGHG